MHISGRQFRDTFCTQYDNVGSGRSPLPRKKLAISAGGIIFSSLLFMPGLKAQKPTVLRVHK
jgi:hypothetical protein